MSSSSSSSLPSSPGDKWVLGVTLGLLGSVAINTGNNIQALGLKQLQDRQQQRDDGGGDARTNKTRRRAHKTKIRFSRIRLSFLSVAANGNNKHKILPENDDNNDGRGSSSTEGRNNNDDDDKSSRSHLPLSDETTTPEAIVVIQPYHSRVWVFGTILFVSGSLLNFTSYAFAAQSTLASLESIQFVTNILFGKFMLGAEVTRVMVAGTLLTVLGTVCAVQFSSKETLDLNTDDIKALYSNPAYITYLIMMGCAVVVLHFVYEYYEKKKARRRRQPADDDDDDDDENSYDNIIMSFSYAVWSALFGTQSVVQAKVLAELLAVQSAGQEDIFVSWFTYVTIVLWVCTVSVWLRRLNDALGKFDPLYILPLLQCGFIFFAIVSGGIFFREFENFTPGQWIGFSCGVFVMLGGLFLLTPPLEKNDRKKLTKEMIDILLKNGGGTILEHMDRHDHDHQDKKETSNTAGDKSISDGPGNNTHLPHAMGCSTDNSTIKQEQQQGQHERNIKFSETTEHHNEHETDTTTRLKLENDDIQLTPEKVRERLRDAVTRNGSSSSSGTFKATTTTSTKRSPRLSNGALVESIMETVRDMAKNGPQFLVSSHNGTAVYTDAMISARKEKLYEKRRREKVLELCKIVSNGGEGMTGSIVELMEELREEYHNLNSSDFIEDRSSPSAAGFQFRPSSAKALATPRKAWTSSVKISPVDKAQRQISPKNIV